MKTLTETALYWHDGAKWVMKYRPEEVNMENRNYHLQIRVHCNIAKNISLESRNIIEEPLTEAELRAGEAKLAEFWGPKVLEGWTIENTKNDE